MPPLWSINELELTIRLKLIKVDQRKHQYVSWQATTLVAH